MMVREGLRDLVPPLALRAYHKWRGQSLRFGGSPLDWAEAERMSSGYSEAAILERVRTATRAVVAGEAAYERDSVLFDEPDYPFALITALLRAAASADMRLDVIDFGGSLGSTYRQCRPLLDAVQHLQWHVVEQPHFVEAGRQEFETDELHFWRFPSDIPPPRGTRLILLSGVLQYLEKPFEILADLSTLPAKHLVIDRLPIVATRNDRLVIQTVPARIYSASYPCRLFVKQNLLDLLASDWQPICEFSCVDGSMNTDDGQPFEFRGFLLDRQV